jgi:hypothetical protein
MRRVLSFLSDEVDWGRLAGIALVAALLFYVIPAGTATTLVTLLIYSISGMIVERGVSRYPFWHSMCFGLLAVIFQTAMFLLYDLGSTRSLPPFSEVTALWLYLSLPSIFQALAGTWISYTFRRVQRTAAERAAQEGAAPKRERPAKSPSKKSQKRGKRGK